MKILLRTLKVLFILFVVACNDGINQEELITQLKKTTNKAILEKVEDGLQMSELKPLKLVLLERTEDPAAHVYIDSIVGMLKKNAKSNQFILWNALTIERSLLIEKGETGKALQIARRCLSMYGKHDSIELADLFHDMGITFMHLNQPDSVSYYWKKAYLRTEETKDYKRLTVTAFNLAAHYHNQGLFDLSRKLFTRTIEIMEKLGKKSPLLINNIISTMIARGKYQEADHYWKEHADELKSDVKSYHGQVIHLNRAVLDDRLGNYSSTDSILNILKGTEIENLLMRDYVQSLIYQSLRKNTDTLSDMRYVGLIPGFSPYLLHNNYKKFTDFIRQARWNFIKDTLAEIYKKHQFDSSLDPRHLRVMSKFLATETEKNSPVQAIQFYRDMIGYQNQLDEITFKNDQLAYNELSDYESAMSQLVSKSMLLESSKNREVMYFVILILLVTTLSLGFYSVRQKLNVSAERSKWLEKEKEQADELILSNQRLVEYSKVILERNNHIKQRLNKLELKGKSAVVVELKNIIKELDVMNKVNTDEKPQIADNLIEKIKPEVHPELSKLSKVEQRIYVLSQNEYRPKDIANMLGYSVQYVRNVKSRIVKKIEEAENS